jgi:hypothetical protein
MLCEQIGDDFQSSGELGSYQVDPVRSPFIHEITELLPSDTLASQFVEPACPGCHRNVGVFPVHVPLLLVVFGLLSEAN